MVPFMFEIRRMGYRVLGYLDDFLISPSPLGVVATLLDCQRATVAISKLMRRLGLSRNVTKGEWVGSQVVSHLGVVIETKYMKFYIQPHKVKKVQQLSGRLLLEVRMGRRWVSERALRHFCGVCVSLTLAMPWARFYTRSLYWDISRGRLDARGRRRLSHQSIRDLCKWRKLSRSELSGRCMLQQRPDAMRTDAAVSELRCWGQRTFQISGHMELERQSRFHLSSRTQGYSKASL